MMALQQEHGAVENDSSVEQGETNGSVDTVSQGDFPQDVLDHEGDRSGQGSEDLFLNIAESPRHRNEEDDAYRVERRRSRRTRATQRQILPNNSLLTQMDNPVPAHSRADGASSAGSSAAPTTVWDEVEDLKSRIARLELARNVPTTSGAMVSNGSADRPRTATTTVTTISSSPKQLRKPSASGSSTDTPIGGRWGAELHPTLHTALAKCKAQLSPTLYRSLAAAASDALELAALTGSGGPQGTAFTAASIINGVAAADRQVRRKADNVCRSLTELCIALCDARSTSTDSTATAPTTALAPNLAANLAIRRASLQQNGPASALSRSTRASTEPPERSTPSRALNRIEARRSSLLGLNGTSSASTSDSASREPETIHDSIEDTGSVTPKTASRSAHPATHAARAGTSLLHTRRVRAGSGAGAEDDAERTRPLSRAMTEIEPPHSDRGARLSVGGGGGHAQRLSLSRDFAAKHAPESPYTHAHSSPLAHASSLRSSSRQEGAGSHIPGSALRGAVLEGSRRYGARGTPERGLGPEAAAGGGSEGPRQRVVSLGLDGAGKGEGELGRRSLGRRVRQSTPGATAVSIRGE
ncbi:hypothetical protein H2201_008305 [Coniosporium apollinis]|uniref:Uncharacterized protein n=1 Tax=Coniosporium apollinis TaxID=61459 RepID=A0ABQ9NKT3_9PEZI|nr:hypothetical protein H2201_008305 [Coniosporium apollinis]